MKKIIFIYLFIFSNYCSFAQLKYGFTAGVQFPSVKIENTSTDPRFSFNAGFATRGSLAEGIDIHIQLLLTAKGVKFYDYYGYKNLIRPLYLQLPVVFRFKFETQKSTKIFLGAGGYYAFGIGGDKVYYPSGYKETEKISYGNDINDDLKQSDLGLVFQLGGEFRENYEGHFFYDMGFKNIIPNATTNSFNRVFGFNLTWYF